MQNNNFDQYFEQNQTFDHISPITSEYVGNFSTSTINPLNPLEVKLKNAECWEEEVSARLEAIRNVTDFMYDRITFNERAIHRAKIRAYISIALGSTCVLLGALNLFLRLFA